MTHSAVQQCQFQQARMLTNKQEGRERSGIATATLRLKSVEKCHPRLPTGPTDAANNLTQLFGLSDDVIDPATSMSYV